MTTSSGSRENKVKRNASAVIAAAPDRRRNSLLTLLRAVPQIRIIGQADDAPSALGLVADHYPDLLVLDAGLPDDGVWMVLGQVKAEWHQTCCLVLVDTIQQRRMAETANADAILVNGFSIDKFFTAIGRLLSSRTAHDRSEEQC
jgi:DNA-binding NarL/FixJ family response regulator